MSQPTIGWGLPHLNYVPVTVYSALLPLAWDKMPFIAQQRYLLEIEALDRISCSGGVFYIGNEDESEGLELARVVDFRDGEDLFCFLVNCVDPWLEYRMQRAGSETRDIQLPLSSIGFVAEGVSYDDPKSTRHFFDIQARLLDDANRYWVRTPDGSGFTRLTAMMRESIRDAHGEEFLYEEGDKPVVA